MISNRIRKAIQISVFATGAALAGGSAQAAAYTGTWDPAFSPHFPNLGWKGSANFYIPDACLLSADAWIDNAAACSGGGMSITSGHVDFYNLSTNEIVTSFNFGAGQIPVVTEMQVVNHDLAGVNGGFILPWNADLSSLGYGTDSHFWLAFAGGPQMFYVTCDDLGGKKPDATVLPFPDAGENPTGWVNQNFHGQCGSDVTPYGWSSSDQPGGGAGPLSWSTSGSLLRTDLVTTNIPEPASLALVLGALGAGWVARRRRAS